MRFEPPWWCRNRHLQTIGGALFRRQKMLLRRERFGTSDGDFVDLDWLDRPGAVPLILVLHGLEGSAQSPSVTGLLREIDRRGWRAVVMNFRSCSGELNRLPRLYHAGDTGDFDEVVTSLVQRSPEGRVGAVGISLGGNVLLKWLGERRGAVPAQFVGAVAISVPFDLAVCARRLERGFARAVYVENFLRKARRKIRRKAILHPGFVDVTAVILARTPAEYDRAVTVPLYGFSNEKDYWTQSSSGRYLPCILKPTLLINALDDPLVPPEALPLPRALPPSIRMDVTSRGGHTGFIEGRWPWQVWSWAYRRAADFLATQFTCDTVGEA